MPTTGTTAALMKTNHIENKDNPHQNKELPTTGTTVALMKAEHISNKGKPRQNKNCLLPGQR